MKIGVHAWQLKYYHPQHLVYFQIWFLLHLRKTFSLTELVIMRVDHFFFFFFFYRKSLFIYLFIYLWLCWVFVSVRGLSLAVASGGHLFIAVRGPLTITASLVAEHRLQTRRLSNRGSRAQLLRGTWDPPRPGPEPASPALAGRFSTTAPPGKPDHFLKYLIYLKNLWILFK